jgi:RNA polymerase sigma-70 factor, ECF subfamily
VSDPNIPAATPDEPASNAAWLPALYDELKRLARAKLGGQKMTLTPTALVHEAWLKLKDFNGNNRAHFMAVAAQAMRQVLVNYAMAAQAQKRQFDRVSISSAADALIAAPFVDVLALDQALNKLQAHDPRAAKLVELRAFAGLELTEAAASIGVSEATAKRDWNYAKLWLARELQGV